MDEQALQAKIDMREARITFLEQHSAGEGGAVHENGHAWPIPTLGSGEGGLIRPFNISGGKVCNCRIYAPDTELTCGDYTIDTTKGNIYVHVDRTDSSGAGSSYTLSVDQDDTRALSSTHARWLLYVYEDGEATLDCRPGVLPVFPLL